MVSAISSKFSAEYAQQPWTTYTVAGQKAGQYKQAGTFSYLRVYGAGHEVPAYTYGTLNLSKKQIGTHT
jgi:carboxypeptidase C (cathepsin A)